MVTVHGRIWLNANKKQRHIHFLEPVHYANFHQENNNAIVGYDVWQKVVEKVGPRFVSNPSNQSCVEIKISALQHAMAEMFGVLMEEGVTNNLWVEFNR